MIRAGIISNGRRRRTDAWGETKLFSSASSDVRNRAFAACACRESSVSAGRHRAMRKTCAPQTHQTHPRAPAAIVDDKGRDLNITCKAIVLSI